MTPQFIALVVSGTTKIRLRQTGAKPVTTKTVKSAKTLRTFVKNASKASRSMQASVPQRPTQPKSPVLLGSTETQPITTHVRLAKQAARNVRVLPDASSATMVPNGVLPVTKPAHSIVISNASMVKMVFTNAKVPNKARKYNHQPLVRLAGNTTVSL